MDAGHDHMSRIGTAADDGDLVLVPQRRHAGIAAPAVGMDGRSGHGDSLNEGDQTVRRYVRDTAQAEAKLPATSRRSMSLSSIVRARSWQMMSVVLISATIVNLADIGTETFGPYVT